MTGTMAAIGAIEGATRRDVTAPDGTVWFFFV